MAQKVDGIGYVNTNNNNFFMKNTLRKHRNGWFQGKARVTKVKQSL